MVSVSACVDREWNYVLLSTVRSLAQREIVDQPSDSWRTEHLGLLLTDANEINVAITRARHGLIILGM